MKRSRSTGFQVLVAAVGVPLCAAGLAACDGASGGAGPSSAAEIEETTAAASAAGERSCDAARLSATFDAILAAWGGSAPDLTAGELQISVESGVAVSLVEEPGCATWSWNGLEGSVTFDECVMKGSGERLDGRVEISASLEPAGMTLVFDGLAMGGDSMSGSIDMSGDASGAGGGSALSVDLGAALVLTDATVADSGSGSTLDGSGTTVDASGEIVAVVLTDVFTARDDCLPSSGTVTSEGSAAVTLTFLATTPDDGVVAVEAAGAGSVSYEQRYEPCQ